MTTWLTCQYQTKIQLDATVCSLIILLQNYSTCFGCPPHPSSGVLKTVTAASGTGHNIGTATSLQRGQIVPSGHVGGR